MPLPPSSGKAGMRDGFESGNLAEIILELCLYDLEQAGIIILDERGRIYFNQTGGTACMQPRAKGFFIPISNDPPIAHPELSICSLLTTITRDAVGLTQKEADAIDALLIDQLKPDRFIVDRTKLAQSMEAWIYVKVIPSVEFSLFTGYQPFDAVLTWHNSD